MYLSHKNTKNVRCNYCFEKRHEQKTCPSHGLYWYIVKRNIYAYFRTINQSTTHHPNVYNISRHEKPTTTLTISNTTQQAVQPATIY